MKETLSRRCLNCNKSFKTRRLRDIGKYCCNQCQADYEWKVYRLEIEKTGNGNPSRCQYCDSPLPYNKRTNKYCNHSCSASNNNKGVARNKGLNYHKNIEPKYCLYCKKEINSKSSYTIYCSRKCHWDYKWELYKKEIKETGNANPRNNKNASHVIKRYLKEIRGHKCEICGRTEWQGNEIPLILDHIDGHSEDNNLTNLRLVCGNCDMLLPTYKGKNFGNGRANRRKRYAEGKSY